VLLLGVDQNDALHTGKDLLDPGRRLIFRIGAKAEPHQWFARLSHTRFARVSSVICVEESVWQGPQDTLDPFGILFLFLALAIQLSGIVDETLNPAILSL